MVHYKKKRSRFFALWWVKATFFLFVFWWATGSGPRPVQANENRPNIIFIMADDLGIGDIGAYNNQSKIPTPYLDQLAREGMRFTDAHSPSSVCTPTRYGLLTGRYAWRTRLSQRVLGAYHSPLIEVGRYTLPEYLQDQGYYTGMSGKWHLGWEWQLKQGSSGYTQYRVTEEQVDHAAPRPILVGPERAGFDYYFYTQPEPPYAHIENGQFVGPVPSVQGPPISFGAPGLMQPGYQYEQMMPMIGQYALRFLDDQAQHRPNQPFFLYMPLTAPHTPFTPNSPFIGRSQAGLYGDLVTELDDLVGQVVQKVDALGWKEETLIIVTSDNGGWGASKNTGPAGEQITLYGHRSNGLWRGWKSDIFEGGHRVPFIVRWPTVVPANTQRHQTISHIDLMGTVVDLLNVPVPDDAAPDSYSFLPLLGEMGAGAAFQRPPLINHSYQGWFALREGYWKLIMGSDGGGGFNAPQGTIAPNGPGQLYNLQSDPYETNNRYNSETPIVQGMRTTLQTIQQTERSIPAPDADGDGWSDWAEQQVGTHPFMAAHHPVSETVTLPVAKSQLVGLNGSATNPAASGAWATEDADNSSRPYFVREQGLNATNPEYRTRLFWQFDLSGLPQNAYLLQARLRVHQYNRLNTTNRTYRTEIGVSRVATAWSNVVGQYPHFDQPVEEERVIGSNADFGTAITASGFYGGNLRVAGTEHGVIITDVVQEWFEGAPNYGLRLRLTDSDFMAAAFSDKDDPNTPANEEPSLILQVGRPNFALQQTYLPLVITK